MFNVGDVVRIVPEWCNSPDERRYIFVVVEVHEDRSRCYIQCLNSRLSIPPVEYVSFEMIEKMEG